MAVIEIKNTNFQQEVMNSDKPVLLDFWGPACKACEEMEAKTLPEATVQAELKRLARESGAKG